ncbi:7893_t:CDS:2 [Gigaspora margarita]|uniref:7893_t:CDS:1 n=1 Tax=Gigaspora margarita TaxID=4874 RepID=A0ABN7UHG6_GIGMA|nr:7893_t:CDS:2 [Gigaspora margarita]
MDTMKNKYYKPTSAEINEIINSTVPENTQKSTTKWVKILENWRHDVGYDYGIETVTDKDLLEFILSTITKTTKANLTLHINALKCNPTIGGCQKIYKVPRADNMHYFQEDNSYIPHEDIFYKSQEDNKDASSVS